MRILVCDDEQQYSDAIYAAIQRWKTNRGIQAVIIDTFNSSEDLLDAFTNKRTYDIAFLDIQFPGETTGLQVAKELRTLNEQMFIVFVSNYEEYAVDGYKVNALRFISKPISDPQIFECLDIAFHQWQLLLGSFMLVESKQQVFRMSYKSVLYIESRAHYLDIHFSDYGKERLSVRRKLIDLMKDLPSDMFIQCHRSFVINLSYVQRVTRSQICMVDGTEIPMSIKYREKVLYQFKALFQGESL